MCELKIESPMFVSSTQEVSCLSVPYFQVVAQILRLSLAQSCFWDSHSQAPTDDFRANGKGLEEETDYYDPP